MSTTGLFFSEEIRRALEPFLQHDPWLPSDVLPNLGDIDDAPGLFAFLSRTMYFFESAARQFRKLFEQFIHRRFLPGPDIVDALHILAHHRQVGLHDIFDIHKVARLPTVAVNNGLLAG